MIKCSKDLRNIYLKLQIVILTSRAAFQLELSHSVANLRPLTTLRIVLM
jgi:hypothetical protein